MSYADVVRVLGPAEYVNYEDGCTIWVWSYARGSLIGVGDAVRAVGVVFRDDKVVAINRVKNGKASTDTFGARPVERSSMSPAVGARVEGETTRPESRTQSSIASTAELSVTSLIVKKVGGKFRYFFDIRNHTDATFYGTVTVTLLNRHPNTRNGVEAFISNGIPPGGGTSVYMDIFTGPPSVHGDYGVETFSYQVEDGGVVVGRGSGRISSRLETY